MGPRECDARAGDGGAAVKARTVVAMALGLGLLVALAMLAAAYPRWFFYGAAGLLGVAAYAGLYVIISAALRGDGREPDRRGRRGVPPPRALRADQG